jgi:DNA-binding PucR family transcriptional regulator
MAKVRVPRTHVTPDEVITVLNRRLGAGYRVDHGPRRSVRIRRKHFAGADIRIRDVAGATVFRVRGHGLPLLRLPNSLTTARRVAAALRQSAEFRSL